MNQDLHLKLQAYFDGELPQNEARKLADLLAHDAAARALLAELESTRSALAGFEGEIKLPESREFYWSKIQREIGLREGQGRTGSPFSLFAAWRRFLLPAGALAALVLGAFIAAMHLLPGNAPEVELALADSDAFTYRDYSAGTTLVWLAYPAENDLADTDAADKIN